VRCLCHLNVVMSSAVSSNWENPLVKMQVIDKMACGSALYIFTGAQFHQYDYHEICLIGTNVC